MTGRALANQHLCFKSVFSWSIYDFANTIYSAAVVTVYLPLYATRMAGENAPVGMTATFSMIAAGFLAPALGAVTDRVGQTKLFLILATLLCVCSTVALTFLNTLPPLLVAFFAANLMFHFCLVFYNSLLATVAPKQLQGYVSGLGTALGYLGVLFALPLSYVVDRFLGRPYVFLSAAILFLIFALPAFVWVPDRPALKKDAEHWLISFKTVFRNKSARNFLLGNFFLADALNAAILWAAVFLKRVFSISDAVLIASIMGFNFSAAICGYFGGKLTDRYGAKTILRVAILLLGVAIITVATARNFAIAFGGLFLFGGAAIAGTWTAGRKLLIELAPPDKLGAYFGLYGLTTKVSAIGASVVAIVSDFAGFRIAFLTQLIPVILAYGLIQRVLISGIPEQTK